MGNIRTCSICGRQYYEKSSLLSQVSGAASASRELRDSSAIASLGLDLLHKGKNAASGKRDICPDCIRAGYSADVSSSSSKSSNNAEIERKNAFHKEAVNKIKEFEFSEDDTEFVRNANSIIDDYLECSPGLLADGDYKKAYKKRIEYELKVLKDTNPEHYEKLNTLWKEASAKMKKGLLIRLIISGAILLVFTIVVGIKAGGLVYGLGVGLIFGVFPQFGFKSKESKE